MFFHRKYTNKKAEKLPASLNVKKIKHQLETELQNSSDLIFRELELSGKKILITYLKSLVGSQQLNENVIAVIQSMPPKEINYQSISNSLHLGEVKITGNIKEIVSGLVTGKAFIYAEENPFGILADIYEPASRSLERAETESLVYGPKLSFTDSIQQNLNIVRATIDNTKLCVEEITVGTRVKTTTYLMYIADIADTEVVQTFRQRITDIDIDYVQDASVLAQLIEDNSLSVFPQLTTTELPDRFAQNLLNGRVGLLVDRSPIAITGPSTFLSFFSSTEDMYMRWNLGTSMRLLRLLGIFISVLLTPAYVAVITFHYEVIPSPLLTSIGQSRAKVPFPPIFEALLLEFFIELLREAGARLPTKVGQTMGIVGGIVIGQAAVEAGFTSNILIIIIAISALGSFTCPSYLMGTAIRFIRFPIIILAGVLGGIGIMFSFCFILIHLLKLTSLGQPYLYPLYPMRPRDFKYSFFREPMHKYALRPLVSRIKDSQKSPKEKSKKRKDIDE
ncbi:MAG TPA: spore germination protein [Chondromyces sp.]|nr:spore germination protein [Chondromyces sp.]